MQTQNTPAPVAGRLDHAKVNEKLVDKYLAHYGLKQGGKVETRANRLLEFFYKQEHLLQAGEPGGARQATCDTCNGQSEASLEECPFCGATGVEDAGTPAQVVAPEPVTATRAKRSDANGHPPKKPAAKPTPAPKPVAAKADKKPTPAAAPAQKPAQAPKPAHVSGPKALAGAPSNPLAVRKVDEKKVKALDAVRTKIRGYLNDAAQNFWNIGEALLKVNATEAWRHAMVKDAKSGAWVPLHTGFKRFVQDDLGISTAFAYQTMQVAEKFTLADVKRVGSSKLRMIVMLPPEVQAAALADAEAGVSKHEIANRHQTPRQLPPGRSVTAVMVAGQTILPAYKIPAEGKPPVAATRIQDEPYGVLQCENNTQIRVQLTRSPSGQGLQFVLTVSRAKRGEQIVEAPQDDAQEEAGE